MRRILLIVIATLAIQLYTFLFPDYTPYLYQGVVADTVTWLRTPQSRLPESEEYLLLHFLGGILAPKEEL